MAYYPQGGYVIGISDGGSPTPPSSDPTIFVENEAERVALEGSVSSGQQVFQRDISQTFIWDAANLEWELGGTTGIEPGVISVESDHISVSQGSSTTEAGTGGLLAIPEQTGNGVLGNGAWYNRFVATSSGTITDIWVLVYPQLTSTSNSLQINDAGLTPITTAFSFDVPAGVSEPTWVSATLPSPLVITAGDAYWLQNSTSTDPLHAAWADATVDEYFSQGGQQPERLIIGLDDGTFETVGGGTGSKIVTHRFYNDGRVVSVAADQVTETPLLQSPEIYTVSMTVGALNASTVDIETFTVAGLEEGKKYLTGTDGFRSDCALKHDVTDGQVRIEVSTQAITPSFTFDLTLIEVV